MNAPPLTFEERTMLIRETDKLRFLPGTNARVPRPLFNKLDSFAVRHFGRATSEMEQADLLRVFDLALSEWCR